MICAKKIIPKTLVHGEEERKRNLRVYDNDNYVRKRVGEDGKYDENCQDVQ